MVDTEQVLTDEELLKLDSEHVMDIDSEGRVKCQAASDDACSWNDDWPCRIRRLIDDYKHQIGEIKRG